MPGRDVEVTRQYTLCVLCLFWHIYIYFFYEIKPPFQRLHTLKKIVSNYIVLETAERLHDLQQHWKIIFPRREGTYLTGRCKFFELPRRLIRAVLFPYQYRFLFLPSLLLSFVTFALLSQKKRGTIKLYYFFNVVLRSRGFALHKCCSHQSPREFEELQNYISPSGKYLPSGEV